jgi:hypothetical protein
MRYVYSVILVAFMMAVFAPVSAACELRQHIRAELREKLVGVDVDLKDLENEIHKAIHEEMDGEKDRLKEEIRRLKEERRALQRERRRATRSDDDGDEWNGSAMLALGLYGLGAVLLIKRSRGQNME